MGGGGAVIEGHKKDFFIILFLINKTHFKTNVTKVDFLLTNNKLEKNHYIKGENFFQNILLEIGNQKNQTRFCHMYIRTFKTNITKVDSETHHLDNWRIPKYFQFGIPFLVISLFL